MVDELARATQRQTRGPEPTPTALAGVQILRADRVARGLFTVQRPTACFVVQGAKEVAVGTRVLRYRKGEYLCTPIDLPMTGAIVEASAQRPYLCIAVDLDPATIFELASGAAPLPFTPSTAKSVFVDRIDDGIEDTLRRLIACLDDPHDVAVLGRGILRELTYRLMRGRYGSVVREVGALGSQTQRVARAIERLKRDFAEAPTVDELAALAGMSASTFHEHFKRVTGMTPIQYQKQLRLQEARRLLQADVAVASDVAYRVGYRSASQFSREYARQFGRPPQSDRTELLATQRR